MPVEVHSRAHQLSRRGGGKQFGDFTRQHETWGRRWRGEGRVFGRRLTPDAMARAAVLFVLLFRFLFCDPPQLEIASLLNSLYALWNFTLGYTGHSSHLVSYYTHQPVLHANSSHSCFLLSLPFFLSQPCLLKNKTKKVPWKRPRAALQAAQTPNFCFRTLDWASTRMVKSLAAIITRC